MKYEYRTVRIPDIKVTCRRKYLGDIDRLANSIHEEGLWRDAIWVNSDNVLLKGERRLKALRRLEWTEVEAKIVDGQSPEFVKLSTNETGKPLAPSEKVDLVENLSSDKRFPHGEISCKLDSRGAVLEKLGLKKNEYYRAALVCREGIPELVVKMDEGEYSVREAADIAREPKDRQRELLGLSPEERKAEVRRSRGEKQAGGKRYKPRKPSLKPLTQKLRGFQIAATDEEIENSSQAERDELLTALEQRKQEIAAIEARVNAAPPPKRKRRRKGDEEEKPRERPQVLEAELDRGWANCNDKQRADAEAKASALRKAARLIEDGIAVNEAFTAAADGTKWAADTLKGDWYGRGGLAGACDYEPHQWPMVLAPKHYGGGARAEIDRAAWQYFLGDYLRPEAPPLEMCFRNLLRVARSNGWTIPQSSKTLKNKLEREVPRESIVLKREGKDALARTRPAQIRSREGMRAMEALNADGRKSDVFVKWKDGEISRPWLMAWQDIYSGKILAWRIDKSENQDGYRLAFADVLREYGIPLHVWMDNGRAFAAKGLTGGAKSRYRFKVKPDDPVGLLTQLIGPDGIHWATPYHGQAKPIERGFRDMASDIDKDIRLAGAYTGNKTDAKPENYRSKAIPLETFVQVMADGIREHNARQGRRGAGLVGRSFDEVFEESRKLQAPDIAKPSQAQLDQWLLAAEKKRADKKDGSVVLFETRYWDENLSQKLAGRAAAARDVTVRFDPERLDMPVVVEALDGKLIARAEPLGTSKFMDRKAARDHARDVKRHKKNARENAAIRDRMATREVQALREKAAAEEREAEPVRARDKVTAGVFGKGPARKPSKAAAGGGELVDLLVPGGSPPSSAGELGMPEATPPDDFEVDYL